MIKLQIDDLVPEETGIVELVGDDELDLIVGAKNYGTGFVCSVTSGAGQNGMQEECHRV